MNQNPQETEPRMGLTLRQRLLAMSLAAAAGIAVSLVVWRLAGPDTPGSGTQVTNPTGVADVGGPFRLVTHEGVEVTEQDFAGQFLLIYFGYTYCPDVCPLALQFMDDTLDRLGPQASGIQPLFITIDPERDTPGVMKSYLASFRPDLIGLTGSQEAIADVASAYKMYYRRSEPLDGEDPANYGMDHMNIFYLMGPDAHYVAHFMSPASPADVAEAISGHLP